MRKKAYIIIFITACSDQEANKIASALVNEKLVACVNIIPKIHSIYWWENKVCQEDEVMLIANSFPILEGLPEYLNWIEEATK